MKRKKLICGMLLSVSLMVGGVCASSVVLPSVVVSAERIGEDLEGGADSFTVNDDTGVADFFKNHSPMSSEQLNKASYTVSPITNIFGYLMGGIIALTSSGIFLITALDLLYISIPPLRGVLYSGGQSGGYGGMSQGNAKSSQWVSDEAVQCSALLGGGGSAGVSGGYGMGAPQQGGSKSIIMAYLKKRIFFVILFAVCTVILTSSILLGTGVNLAQWGMKLIEILNNSIPAL